MSLPWREYATINHKPDSAFARAGNLTTKNKQKYKRDSTLRESKADVWGFRSDRKPAHSRPSFRLDEESNDLRYPFNSAAIPR